MNDKDILNHVDHTLLAATATWCEIVKLCDEAVEFDTASVCVPPNYIKRIREAYPTMNICTVIGFPLGYHTADAKIAEIKEALADGADEFDMVINVTDVKNGDFISVENEIKALKQAIGSKILKVIIETCYLTDDEKIAVCKAVTNAGADYIKTSTGFGTAGATIADVKLFKNNIGPDVKIKAAGGIRTREDMVEFIDEGCSRLGTSSAIKILAGAKSEGY